MELYNTTPKVISWEGGYGASFVVRKQDSEKLLFLSFVDGMFLIASEPGGYTSDKFFELRRGFDGIDVDDLHFLFRSLWISNSGLSGTLHLFTPPNVKLERIPFRRSDWDSRKYHAYREHLINRFFIGTVPEYVSFYDRISKRLCFVKPEPFKPYFYVDSSGKVKEGLMYIAEHMYIPTTYFRYIPKDDEVYAVLLFGKPEPDYRALWRVEMDDCKYYNILATIDEIKELKKHGKIHRLR